MKMTTSQKDLTINQAAEVLNIHPETLRELARTDRIYGIYKIGGSWRISQDALDTIRRIPAIKEAE